MIVLRLFSRTKLYWGLAIICLIGALASPHTSSGRNIFLSFNNLTDVLRQVSITGLVATGMTLVILLGGIDLSVGSVMGFSTIICAMLLTQPGWTPASIMAVPAAAAVAGLGVGFLARFVFHGLARGRDVDAGRRNEIVLGPWRGVRVPAVLGLVCGALAAVGTASQVSTKFGVLAVLLVTPCVALGLGAINGALIVAGRLQPFIATLAMMVSALGLGRLTAGQDNAVIAVYTGTNATQAFEVLRSMVWGILPMPSVFFLAAILIFGAVLRFTTFGRYIYAIGGNPEAAKLSGIKVAQVQLAAYMISGLLAGLAGVLFVAQYRQGKPDAGSGLELDAIAAVVIGGTSSHGRARRTRRNVRRRAHLRPAFRHPSTAEHRFQRPAPDEGADHRRHGARARTESGSASDAVAKPGFLARASADRIGRSQSAAISQKKVNCKGGHP